MQRAIGNDEIIIAADVAKDYILSIIDNSEVPIRDSKDRRWIKCKKCVYVGVDCDFSDI